MRRTISERGTGGTVGRVIALLLVLGGCGGGGGGAAADTGVPPGTDAVTADGGGGGGGEDGTSASDDGGGQTVGPREIQVFGTSNPTTSFAGGRLAVSFLVFDPEAAVAVAGARVDIRAEVETQPPAGGADGFFEEETALTNGDGVATVVFQTGSVGGAVYHVIGSVEGAEQDAVLVVHVEQPPTGSLQVSFSYAGETPLASLRILLMAQSYICDAFNPGAPPEAVFHEETTTSLDPWTVDGIPQSPGWVVLVVGLDGAGSVVAGGCRSEIRVVADQTSMVTVDLHPAGLHVPGIYAVNEQLDLSAAAPSDAAALATIVRDALADPRGLLAEGFRAVITAHVDATAPESECKPLWEAEVAGAVEAAVPATAAWTAAFEGLAGRIEAALSAVDVSAQWTLSGEGAGGASFAAEIHIASLGLRWDGAALSWTPAEGGAAVYPIRLADETTTLAAGLVGYDRLEVRSHDMVLEPHRIAAALVTQQILGGLPGGPASLAEVAVTFFDCPAVVAGLSGEVTTCLAGYPIYLAVEDLVARCEEVVREQLAPASALLQAWVTPAVVVRLAGAATVVDADQDLGVDRIRDGVLTGEVLHDGTAAGAVTGTFSGIR